MIENTPEAWTARARYNTPFAAALWSRHGQEARFKAVIDALKPRVGEVLLDYGCGTGLLSEYAGPALYIGYDWAEGMVERARRDHPGETFTNEGPAGPFDLVACIGPFNLRDNWWPERTWQTIGRLWEMTTRALAVCLYAGKDKDCIEYTEVQVSSIFHHFDATVTVTRHLPNDILLVIER